MSSPQNIRAVVVVADIHAGSSKGLLPPDFVNIEDQSVPQNPMQVWLWDCWIKALGFVNETMNGDPYAFVANGDMIEGVHHGTKEIISPDVGDHKRAATQILEPVVQGAARSFFVLGTECHVGNVELSIAAELGAETNPESTAGNRGFQRLTLDVAGVRCVFRHHISASVRRGLSATQLSLALAEEQLEAVNNDEPIPRVICAAHRHRWGYFQDDNGIAVVSPCWQFLTKHGHKVVSPARTKPGLYILDWRRRRDGELPEVHKFQLNAPAPTVIKL
jgi:hypothetical protein